MKRTRDIVYLGNPPLTHFFQWTLWLITGAMIVAAAIVYYYYIHISPMLDPSNFHGLQGAGFLAGHTYLTMTPSPQLMALKDPYDPASNQPYVLWDASMYKGRYYLYFGPVPALLWSAVKYTTGVALSDPVLVLGFTTAATACLMILMVRIMLREQMAQRLGLVFALLALALGTWLPFMLRRPSFYEVAVSGAYCFSALGALLLWFGLSSERRRPLFLLALASLCFGLAVGCRMSHVFNIVLPAFGWFFLMQRKPRPGMFTSLLCAFAPWSCCIAGLMIYNFERFDSVFESGWHYQLTYYNAHALTFKPFETKNVVSHLYYYLFRMLAFAFPLQFPFLHVGYYDKVTLPFNVEVETLEPVYGLLTNSPFALWIFATFYCMFKRAKLRAETQVITAGIALYGILMLTILLFFFFSTARYSVDFSPWLMFIAGIQYLRILNMTQSRPVIIILLIAGCLMASWGAFTNTMSGYCGQYLCEPQK